MSTQVASQTTTMPSLNRRYLLAGSASALAAVGQSVKRVEVSVDGGKSWADARLIGPDLGKYAWRQFVLAVNLPMGQFVLTSRATDMNGQVQPQERFENASGYNNTSWLDHAVTVQVA